MSRDGTVIGGRFDRPPRVVLGAVVLAVLASFPLVALIVQIDGGPFRFGGVDFKAYYLAGLRTLAGLPLYESGPLVDRVARPRATAYLYPPVVALPFAVLTLLPPLPARVLWVAGQLLFLWAAALALLRGFGLQLTWRRAAVAFVALVGFQPVFFLARIGNVSGWMAGLFCLSAAVSVAPGGSDRPYLAGALAALAALLKPFAAPAGAHLLGDRRRLVGAAVAVAAAFAVGLLAYGVDAHRAYLDVLVAGKGWGAGADGSLPFHARPFYRVPDLAPYLRAGLLAVAFAAALLAARVGADARAFALGSVAVPLVAPTPNTLTLVLAVPGLLVALALEWREAGIPEVVLGAVLAVHGSVYLVRTVSVYGPGHAPGLPWELAAAALVVQPATVGLLAVFSLCVGRVLASVAGLDRSPVDTRRGPVG